MNRIGLAILLTSMLISGVAQATKEPRPGKTDARITTITYNERDVVKLWGHYGYSLQITFSPSETISHVSAGDSLAWQIVPKANHLFLKPIEDDPETNLLVLTNKRSYHFELRAHNAKSPADTSVTYAVKFHYPSESLFRKLKQENETNRLRNTEVIPDRTISPGSMNFNYTMRGSEKLSPIRTFDDGEFTYFQFPKEIDTPAIFLVNAQKEESIVNYHVSGKFIVVERIASRFILRSGKEATCIYNEGYKERFKPSELPQHVKTKASIPQLKNRSHGR